ncbi:hypothetical protein C8Q74DRAFT_984245 [Fomes fomentarius]|nr:hypothetical protein C8Q74DRAFT_984245 [Fomes fomentarius]
MLIHPPPHPSPHIMILPELQRQRRQPPTHPTQTLPLPVSDHVSISFQTPPTTPTFPPWFPPQSECGKDPTHSPCFPPEHYSSDTHSAHTSTPPYGTYTTPTPTITSLSSGIGVITETSAESSTGTQMHPPPPHHSPPHQSNPARTAAVVLLVLAALAIFFWLFRRGTFGSGKLFGMKYGDARFEGRKKGEGEGSGGGLPLGRRQMQQKDGEQEYARVSEHDASSSTASLPPYPASLSNANYTSTSPSSPSALTALSSTAVSHPSTSHAPLLALPSHLIHARHAPQLSHPSSSSATLVNPVPKRAASPTSTTITEWSTSPSAFDKAYGMRPGSVATHTTGTSTSSVGIVPQQTGSSASSDPFNPPRARDREHEHEQEPPPYDDPFLAPHETGTDLARNVSAASRASAGSAASGASRLSVETARTDRTGESRVSEMSVRTGTSTVDGVRISSWHSSDSEGTELRGPVAGMGMGRIGLR